MSRKINVKKEDVLDALKKNKEQHAIDYKEAKELYKEEGLRQITEIKSKLEAGETKLYLKLTEPIDRTDWYENRIKMFEMEVNEVVELDQHEFESLILDNDDEIKMAKYSNSTYMSIRH
jgi:hypothetical protein